MLILILLMLMGVMLIGISAINKALEEIIEDFDNEKER